MLRNILPSMDQVVVGQIDARLDAISREQNVAIPLAIESGSRAWGFPSPDSDYDCRFIYVRTGNDYLSLFPPRDVIETPIENDLDLNGWDIAKALRLLLKGNAVVIEWLTSPVIYGADPWFRDEFLGLARNVADRERIACHYLHLGERQSRTHFSDGAEVKLKAVFYALRPATALRWLRLHPREAIAPMHFPTLIAECDMPAEVLAVTHDLMARKAVTRELGSAPLPAPIAAFIAAEYAAARQAFDMSYRPIEDWMKKQAQDFFHAAVARHGRAHDLQGH